jgi:hypothetical protein
MRGFPDLEVEIEFELDRSRDRPRTDVFGRSFDPDRRRAGTQDTKCRSPQRFGELIHQARIGNVDVHSAFRLAELPQSEAVSLTKAQAARHCNPARSPARWIRVGTACRRVRGYCEDPPRG